MKSLRIQFMFPEDEDDGILDSWLASLVASAAINGIRVLVQKDGVDVEIRVLKMDAKEGGVN